MPEVMPPQLAPSVGAFLTRNVIGVPVWVWAVILVAVVLFLRMR